MGEACISNIFHVRCLIYAVSPCLNYIMISVAENDLWLCLGSKKKKKKQFSPFVLQKESRKFTSKDCFS